MRGKVKKDGYKFKCKRITPAYAGKRLCAAIKEAIERGSPPHMREKGYRDGKEEGELGITPAYAGKS